MKIFLFFTLLPFVISQQVPDRDFNTNHLFCPSRRCYLTAEQAGVTNVCTRDEDCTYNIAVMNNCGFAQGQNDYSIGTTYKCLDLDDDNISHCALSCLAQPNTPCLQNQPIDTEALQGGDYTLQINCSFMRNGTEIYVDCPCHRAPTCNSLPVCSDEALRREAEIESVQDFLDSLANFVSG